VNLLPIGHEWRDHSSALGWAHGSREFRTQSRPSRKPRIAPIHPGSESGYSVVLSCASQLGTLITGASKSASHTPLNRFDSFLALASDPPHGEP
jgi:hypothetical protein